MTYNSIFLISDYIGERENKDIGNEKSGESRKELFSPK